MAAIAGADRQDDLLDPSTDAAKIRAFFVHPDWARRGIGTLVLDACESAARAAGFTRFEMGATLTGVKLFQHRGYVALERLEVPLEGDITLPVVHMVKETLVSGRARLAQQARDTSSERSDGVRALAGEPAASRAVRFAVDENRWRFGAQRQE